MKVEDVVVFVDSNEPDEFVEELVKKRLRVKKRQLRHWKCSMCGTWFPDNENFPTCSKCHVEPDSNTHKERIADVMDSMGIFGRERKGEGDFYNSLLDGRIYEQMDRIDAAFEIGYLDVMGYLDSIAMDHPARSDWIYSIKEVARHEYGIYFNEACDFEALARDIKWSIRKIGEEKKTRKIPGKRTALDPRLAALENNCQGVGRENACMLGLVFGTMKKIANAPTDILESIVGFGDTTITRVGEFFNGKIILPDGWTPSKGKIFK